MAGAAAISAGAFHTCAVLETGTAGCGWSDPNARLGAEDRTNPPFPVPVPRVTSAAAGAGDGSQACALLARGKAQ